jgi:multidrug efflux pump subunit AcrB/outer membrane protein TolC
MNFVKKSLKYPQVTVSVLVICFLAGLYSLLYMPRREDAKFQIRIAQVVAYYPGASSLQVEEQVTRKLEQYLFQHAEVRKEKTVSTSRDGAVIITVWLHDRVENVDIFWSKLNHELQVLKATALPPGVYGPVINFDFGDTEAMVIGIEMASPDYAQLREHAAKLEDALKTIPNVSKIKRIGEQKETIVIEADSVKLKQFDLSFATFMQVLPSQNAIGPTGDVKTADSRISLYSRGYYKTQTDIADQVVGTAKTGQVVRLRDVARVSREYQDPSSIITVNGKRTILLAVQMQEGCNIIQFGKDVDEKIAQTQKRLPSDVSLVLIVNQAKIVDKNVSQFLKEFVMAIIAVIVVIVLLLPFRVAAVAAMAIPMTVSITFAVMHAIGMELHQVSLSSLILVLGMVVDDAVVVADNYVTLLDAGVDRRTAAWRSATDLVVPILTATLTIIGAFLPLVLLTGMVKEFIIALPMTVTIALSSSFVVAMFLTPILCYTFIKKGLGGASMEETTRRQKLSVLSLMQMGYDRTIAWCMVHSGWTIAACLSTVLLALLLYQVVPQKFFPAAERNQFVIDLWMRTGAKLAKTEETILKVQSRIQSDKRVVSYATFIGTSSPRFYYNFTPEPPVENFAQILVNTHTDRDAVSLHHEINAQAKDIPEGTVQARLMQQGKPSTTSVEVRISGDDLSTLRKVGREVGDILRSTRKIAFIRDDFKEDYSGVAVQLKESAERLGFTTTSVAKTLYGGFTGAGVSTLYEGDKPVDIVVRLDRQKRRDFDDLQNMYVTSPVTGAAVPLRQIAVLEPEWHTGRIIHRNGLRTLTVQCEPVEGVLASQIVKDVKPALSKLSLPPGYKIEWGGEHENMIETYLEMSVAFALSVLVIFLVLLFQFRNIKETLIVMLTIPLSLFGGFLGLLVTQNPFGFTSFVGLISLSGLVVRNAIILMDYADELVQKGTSIPEAALLAGKRRMRPVFLTASAAAIGVIPMILSGSPMWSPLAAVISVGIMMAMAISLVLVPVLYARAIKPSDKPRLFDRDDRREKSVVLPGGLGLLVLLPLFFHPSVVIAQENPERLNLEKVMDLAVQNSRLVAVKHLQIEEKKHKVIEDRIKYFPAVNIGVGYQYQSDNGGLSVPKGVLGQYTVGPVTITVPSSETKLDFGAASVVAAGIVAYQPVSQIPKITAGVQVAKTDLEIAKIEGAKAAQQVKQTAEKLYYGLLILQKQKEEALLKRELAEKKLYDVESAVLAGKTSRSNLTGLKANVADEEQNLLKISIQIEDYSADLKRLIGMPASSSFVLDPIHFDSFDKTPPPEEYASLKSLQTNYDLKIARLYKAKAKHALDASRFSYLPDFGILGGYLYLNSDRSFGVTGQSSMGQIHLGLNSNWNVQDAFIGVALRWNVQDMFSNIYVEKQREALERQAAEGLANTREQVFTDIAKTRRKLIQSAELMNVAASVLAYRLEDLKIQTDRREAGLNLEADLILAKAAVAKAEGDVLAARLNYRMAWTELKILTGDF